jgi:hypothetical protein
MMLFGTYVNLIAVLVAAVVAFALGALWYSRVLFAKPWVKAHGYDNTTLQELQKGAGRAYGVSFVALLVMALALSIFIGRIGIAYWLGGVKAGVLAWIGFVATTGLMANMYSRKPINTWLIDAGYQLVYLAIMGGIIGGWR